MKQQFGAKLARSYMRSVPWIDINHKKEDADAVSIIGQSCGPSRMIVEFQASSSVQFTATRLECAAPISGFNRESNGTEKLENLKVQKLEIKLRAVMLRASCLRMRRDANS